MGQGDSATRPPLDDCVCRNLDAMKGHTEPSCPFYVATLAERRALTEVNRLRGVLEAIERIVWDESLTDEQVIGGVQQAIEDAL